MVTVLGLMVIIAQLKNNIFDFERTQIYINEAFKAFVWKIDSGVCHVFVGV